MTNTDPVTYISALKRLLMRIEEKHSEHGLQYRRLSAEALIKRMDQEYNELNNAWSDLVLTHDRDHNTRDQVRAVKEELLDVAVCALLALEQAERRVIFTSDWIDHSSEIQLEGMVW